MIRAAVSRLCCAHPLHLQAVRCPGISDVLRSRATQHNPILNLRSGIAAAIAQPCLGLPQVQILARSLHSSTTSSSKHTSPWWWAGLAASVAAAVAATGLAASSSADSRQQHSAATQQYQHQHQHHGGAAPASQHQHQQGKAAEQRRRAELTEDSSWYERLQDMYHRAVVW
jgi:hypothetical protein